MDMENTSHQTKLTSPELGLLWTTYINDSMTSCVFKHFLATVEDKEIQPIIKYALELSEKHVARVAEIFKEEHLAVPQGFTDDDLNLSAPRLFSDSFILDYVQNTAKYTLNLNSLSLAYSTRADIRNFYSELVASITELFQRSSDVMLSKGIYIRPPYITAQETVEFVQEQSFLNGWFGERRPLNSIEIGLLFFNMTRNILGETLLTGFSQVAKSQQVRDYMLRGKEIAKKHAEIFSSILREDDIPSPMTWDSGVTQSTVTPFSDKLMIFHITALIAGGIGFYGTASGTSARRDLGVHYARLSVEIAKYAEGGANIMIRNEWLEQPPTAPNRKDIAKGEK
jgi:hypothetical protein